MKIAKSKTRWSSGAAGLVLSLIWLLPLQAAYGGSWVFEQSYYTHQPTSPVQIGPRSVGGPYYSRPYGVSVRSGYRQIRSNIRVNGRSYDNTMYYESWIQLGDQY